MNRHYHITHRAVVNGVVADPTDDGEICVDRRSAGHTVDRIIRDFQRRRHVSILRDVDWVRISWYAERSVAHEFRLVSCSKEQCLGGGRGGAEHDS